MSRSLHEAFALFSEETARLETAYRSLQEEFHVLSLKLSESSHTLNLIVEHLSEGLIFIKKDGAILFFNPSAQALLDIHGAVQGTLFSEFFSDDLFGSSLCQLLKGEGVNKLSIVQLERGGKAKEIEVSFSSVTGIGLLILLRDLSEIKRLSATISQHDRLRALGEMAATLAHEIRNPLGGIQGFASLLKDDLSHMPKQQEMVRHILEGTHLLNGLVSSVLDYARPLSCHFEEVNLEKLCTETILLAHASLKNKRIQFRSEPVFAIGDSSLLKRALLNLLLNALEASKEPIVLHLVEVAGYAQLVVEDFGEGISDENLDKIFTPFFTTKIKGTGLGLSEVQKIVQAHSGTIVIERPVVGTKFTLRIPLK